MIPDTTKTSEPHTFTHDAHGLSKEPFVMTTLARNDIQAAIKVESLLVRNVKNFSESQLVSRLEAIPIDPETLNRRDNSFSESSGESLLHTAARFGRSPIFCKVLHELDATLVKSRDHLGWLPLHSACREGRADTAKYLCDVSPDSINIQTTHGGWYPLHLIARGRYWDDNNENETLIFLDFLLKHDRGAVSSQNSNGNTPLHLACEKRNLAFVKLLFDAHPDGIHIRNDRVKTPLDIARRSENQGEVASFFETQHELQHQARENTEPDENCQLPIHRTLQTGRASIGTIKLMVAANPASVTRADSLGCLPLHLACRFGNWNIVEYLVGRDEDSITTADTGRNLPLHYACLGGKLDIVNYILENQDFPSGVSIPNKEGNKLPINLLLFDTACDRDDLKYIDTIHSLLRENPKDSVAILSPGLFADES